MGQSSINRLADYIIKIAGLAAMVAICCIFSNVLVYILSAVVVSLIGHPIVRIFRKIHIKKLHIPDWISALLTILIIVAMLALIIAVMIPMVMNIINEASVASDSTVSGTSWIEGVNQWLIGIFPGLGPDFNLITSLLKVLSDALSFSGVTGFVGSVAGVVVDIVVGVFTVSFISFFFLKDETLFGRIICALVPNKIEQMVSKTLDEIRQLLSRYFVGLLLEMLGVALINFLGIWLIARLDVSYALGIAVIAGILNIIPWRRIGCERVDLRCDYHSHHVGGSVDRQFRLPAFDLLYEHQGSSVGDLHRLLDGWSYRWHRGHASSYPSIHCDPCHRCPLLLSFQGHSATCP